MGSHGAVEQRLAAFKNAQTPRASNLEKSEQSDGKPLSLGTEVAICVLVGIILVAIFCVGGTFLYLRSINKTRRRAATAAGLLPQPGHEGGDGDGSVVSHRHSRHSRTRSTATMRDDNLPIPISVGGSVHLTTMDGSRTSRSSSARSSRQNTSLRPRHRSIY